MYFVWGGRESIVYVWDDPKCVSFVGGLFPDLGPRALEGPACMHCQRALHALPALRSRHHIRGVGSADRSEL